jgi:hypothetical protein
VRYLIVSVTPIECRVDRTSRSVLGRVDRTRAVGAHTTGTGAPPVAPFIKHHDAVLPTVARARAAMRFDVRR